MSFDLSLATLCDHVVYKELDVIDDDLRTIRLQKPLASSKISLFASDNIVPDSMYDIVQDPLTIDVSMSRMIYLKKEWRSTTDFFEITYRTISSYCTKCNGTNNLDDLTFNVKGSLTTTRDEPLLVQNLEKFVVTRLNSNAFHTFIGTGIEGLIGTRLNNVEFLVTQLKSEVTRGLQKLQDLQSQYRLSGRVVTPGEILQSIDNITVTQDVQDPTVFRIDVTVTAESGQTVEFAQFIRLRG